MNWHDCSVANGNVEFGDCPCPLVNQCVQLGGMTWTINRPVWNSTVEYTVSDGTIVITSNTPRVLTSLVYFNCITIDNSNGGNRMKIGNCTQCGPGSTGHLIWNGGRLIDCGCRDLDIVDGTLCITNVCIYIGEDLHLSEFNADTWVEFSGGCMYINDSIQMSVSAGMTSNLTFNCQAIVYAKGCSTDEGNCMNWGGMGGCVVISIDDCGTIVTIDNSFGTQGNITMGGMGGTAVLEIDRGTMNGTSQLSLETLGIIRGDFGEIHNPILLEGGTFGTGDCGKR